MHSKQFSFFNGMGDLKASFVFIFYYSRIYARKHKCERGIDKVDCAGWISDSDFHEDAKQMIQVLLNLRMLN